MDSFTFDFETDSTLTSDTNSTGSNLDWTAFQSAPPQPPPALTSSPFSPTWLSQQDDAVAPDNRATLMSTPHDDGIYFEIEHFFNGLHQEQQQQQQQQQQQMQLHASSQEEQGLIEPIHVNIHIPDQTRADMNQFELSVGGARTAAVAIPPFLAPTAPLVGDERPGGQHLSTHSTRPSSLVVTFAMLP